MLEARDLTEMRTYNAGQNEILDHALNNMLNGGWDIIQNGSSIRLQNPDKKTEGVLFSLSRQSSGMGEKKKASTRASVIVSRALLERFDKKSILPESVEPMNLLIQALQEFSLSNKTYLHSLGAS